MSLAGKSSGRLINIFPLASKYYHYYHFLWATWQNSKQIKTKQYRHEMYIVLSCGKTTLGKHDKGIYSNVLNLFNYLLHPTNCCKS